MNIHRVALDPAVWTKVMRRRLVSTGVLAWVLSPGICLAEGAQDPTDVEDEPESRTELGFEALEEGVFFIGSARGQVDANTGDSGAAIGTGFELQRDRYFASFVVSAGSEQPSFNDQSDFGRFLLAPHLSPVSGQLEVDVYAFPLSLEAENEFLFGASAGLFAGRGEWETVFTPPANEPRPETTLPVRVAADATAMLVTFGPVMRWVVRDRESKVGVDAWLFAGGGLRFLTLDLAANARAIGDDAGSAEALFLKSAIGEDQQAFCSFELQAGADVEGIRIVLETVVADGPEGLDGVHIMPTIALKPGVMLLSLEEEERQPKAQEH